MADEPKVWCRMLVTIPDTGDATAEIRCSGGATMRELRDSEVVAEVYGGTDAKWPIE